MLESHNPSRDYNMVAADKADEVVYGIFSCYLNLDGIVEGAHNCKFKCKNNGLIFVTSTSGVTPLVTSFFADL